MDLSEVPEQAARELLPPGMYECYIESVEFGTSNRSGNKMFTWRLKAQKPDGSETTLFYHTTFSEKDLPRTKHSVAVVLGSEAVDWKNFNPSEIAGELGGHWVRARVRIQNSDEYGKSNSVAALLPSQGEQGSDFAV